MLILALLLLVVVIVVLVTSIFGGSGPADDPALAASARAALAANATVAPYVDTVTAENDGSVIVTLNETSAALAGTSGSNGAEKMGAYVNAVVLDAVPAAKSVGTFDADNKMLELSTRK